MIWKEDEEKDFWAALESACAGGSVSRMSPSALMVVLTSYDEGTRSKCKYAKPPMTSTRGGRLVQLDTPPS